MISDSTKILVLCTGNSCRSQMAEGLFRHQLNNLGLTAAAGAARSAGLEPHGVNPNAIRVMSEIGIDISGHSSDHLQDYLDGNFDFLITVCDNADKNCPSFPGSCTRMHWPFDDPAKATGTDEQIISEFRRVRDEICKRVQDWLARN